jgi:hypothetical protein
MHDQADALENILLYEKDPIERMRAVSAASKRFNKLFRDIEREAAYEARFKYPASDVAMILDIDRRHIDYLIAKYLEDNPHKEPPPHHNRSKIESYVDLSQGNDHHSRQADTRNDQS